MAFALWVYDPSVASEGFERINNTGLLQRQFMLFIGGAVALVSGVTFVAAGRLIDLVAVIENRHVQDAEYMEALSITDAALIPEGEVG